MDRLPFKVGSVYRNNLGMYRVLTVIGGRMRVQYQNQKDQTAILNVEVQWRIDDRLARQAAEDRDRLARQGAEDRWKRDLAGAALKDAVVEGWFRRLPVEPEHKGRCSRTGTCPTCANVWSREA